MSYEDDYKKYRGKCKEMCEELVKADPSLTLVRGHYYEPLWSREDPHWWCVDREGNIIDPTAKQFPTPNIKEFYTEFDGWTECAQCGKSVEESALVQMGNYPVCSDRCAMALVGL